MCLLNLWKKNLNVRCPRSPGLESRTLYSGPVGIEVRPHPYSNSDASLVKGGGKKHPEPGEGFCGHPFN